MTFLHLSHKTWAAINHHFYCLLRASLRVKKETANPLNSVSQNIDDGKCQADMNTSSNLKADLTVKVINSLLIFKAERLAQKELGRHRRDCFWCVNEIFVFVQRSMIDFFVLLYAGNSSTERTHHLQPATELQPQPTPGIRLSNKR